MENILKSFSTEPGGWSARKLSAFAGLSAALIIGVFLLPASDRLFGMVALLLFVLLCLGLVTFEQILRFKNGEKKNKDENSITNENTTG